MNQPLTIQEFITGYEIETPVINYNSNPIAFKSIGLSVDGKKKLDDLFLTYEIVYEDGYQFFEFDEFDPTILNDIIETVKNSALVLGLEGFSRIDMRVREDGAFHIMDVATYPHAIKHSSFWFMMKSLGYEYADVFALLTVLAAKRYNWID